MTPLRRALAALLALVLGPHAQAGFSIPGYELVQTAPVETTLVNDDLRSSAAVWSQLFDEARSEIVIGQFYAISKAGTPFDKVVERLEAAGARGVKIRFLLDKKGVGLSDPATLARLRQIPNLDMRVLDYAQLTGTGIIHAKYIAVDKKAAFIGSQNFDWRAFTHIHETGLLITDAAMVAQVHAVFERDWQAQSLLAANLAVPRAVALAVAPQAAQLVASPAAFNPPGVADSEVVLPALLADARHEVRIQLLDYAPLGYGPENTRPYYGVIDNAVRAAAARGVKIKLMVSNWNTEQPGIAYLKSLALLPNVEVRIVTLPAAAGGPIPFARVIHSKTMSIDGKLAWVGTSNWAGGYFDKSRNLEVVLRNEKMAQRLGALHEQTWSSSYAQPIDIAKDYPKPNKGNE
ncbi:phospholipase D-like domain-containing protein [Massilia sp. P8910]|uniref:phospholipase D-like domain-containing protein n=1 Tax=Massilia antarctica TaxID=2765360 RepID=UPI0006BB6C67|nr:MULTISPECIES: phospholipase D-like domain-containing protein [Massilia]MCE3603350.1 phospholipase D-like domain-containing protein [Massilia antarctica]MCY0913013.1 phospholipase D-like domain-containing protein [Massilia sp. H27-R4]CUI07594.1 Phosphatidylserine/phosphatidylglycerophosphate/ cardiolipi n synthases and related enzymes [Janthinobacterium sp. CG23_2]CUU31380.1 Phosphatidylserine/phosphatidylglycerophosphate/ cardiolipi n synthases and related enzymes [Janthinobacterium sp. CG23